MIPQLAAMDGMINAGGHGEAKTVIDGDGEAKTAIDGEGKAKTAIDRDGEAKTSAVDEIDGASDIIIQTLAIKGMVPNEVSNSHSLLVPILHM